jgi:hypothetical protein
MELGWDANPIVLGRPLNCFAMKGDGVYTVRGMQPFAISSRLGIGIVGELNGGVSILGPDLIAVIRSGKVMLTDQRAGVTGVG